LFWKDNWAGNTLNSQWPQLASFALNPHRSLHRIINTEDTSLFQLPFSVEVEAFEQYQEMLGLLQNFPIQDQNDTWRFPSGTTSYAVSNTYRILMGEFHTIPAISWLWKANCSQLKHKIFFWLLINDRLNTRGMLLRKSFFIDDYSYVMCDQYVLETRDHLFFECEFAKLCWRYLCHNWSPTTSHIQEQFDSLKDSLHLPFFIILTSWAIWTTRNDFIFRGIAPNLYECRRKFKQEMQWFVYRAKKKSHASLPAWVQSFR
jgi:hypothetical protein